MDKAIAAIHGLSGSRDDWGQLITFLRSHEEALHKAGAQCFRALQEVDRASETIGAVFLLAAGVTAGGDAVQEIFLQEARLLFRQGDREQIRRVSDRFCVIGKRFGELSLELGLTKAAIVPLRRAISLGAPSDEHLTPMHPLLVLCAVLSKCYSAALPTLDQDVYDVDVGATSVTPKDMLLYFYYGAIVRISQKQFGKALESLTLLFTVPAQAVSAVMIAAYKKYVLVSLLVHGKLAPLPKYTPTLVQRHLKAFCGAYKELSNSFGTRSVADMGEVVTKNLEAFEEDKNMGLVQQCIQALFRRNIQRLTQTYLTLSLTDIAENVGLASAGDAERYVFEMIEAGEIHARINQQDGMVEFLEDPEGFASNETREKLDASINACIAMARKLEAVDEEVAQNHQYIYRTQLQDKSRFDEGDGSGGMFGDDMGGSGGSGGGGGSVGAGLSAFLAKQ